MDLKLSRKQFLHASGVSLAAAVAGCSSLSTESESGSQSIASDQSGERHSIGVSYVGTVDTSADAAIDSRAKVLSISPPTATEKRPVVMIPGLGLSPYIYLTTPDGRPGWASLFAAAGYPVHVVSPPRNVDSGGLNTSAFERADPPTLSRWSLDRAWPTWGFGPEVGEPYEDVRYPIDDVDQLVASFPAYVSTGGSGGNGDSRNRAQRTTAEEPETTATPTQSQPDEGGQRQGSGGGQRGGSRFASARETAALTDLLERVGPATLLVHSASGAAGFAVAQSSPSLVENIVAVEPVGCPTDEETVAKMGGNAPVLAVYGDYSMHADRPVAKQPVRRPSN
ncbi:hypothetical protein [Halobellus sp. H-GB7]|uniref:hypothetical protein n=1 Tax=Halobellus sp. H-GB7 TaxID=3069756 RepID=UPI0027B4D261|nr:hypothetical protein [Halobellus sp. H-GB7]MDQ2055662.1 hypothetical protein [Halobellus sp. H-GB7]